MAQLTDFQRFIKANNLKQKHVAEYLETSPQYINQVARGTSNLSDEKYERLVQSGWDISMLDIPPYIKVPATMAIYDGIVPAPSEDGSIDMSVVPVEVVEEIKAEVAEEITAEMTVPIVPQEIANNAETNIREYIKKNASELEHFDPRTITKEVYGAERICTTSMSPTFQPYDIVFIQLLDDKTRITDGKMYYFDTKKWPTMIRIVKVLNDGKLLLKALNPRYGDIILSFDEINNIGDISGMYREVFGDQYAEMEEVRRHKDKQIDNLLTQNSEALSSIRELISVLKEKK